MHSRFSKEAWTPNGWILHLAPNIFLKLQNTSNILSTQTLLKWSFGAFATLAGTLISTSLLWRALSNDASGESKTFPVPPWLGWLIAMENPFCPWIHGNRLVERLLATYRKEIKMADGEGSIAFLDAGCGPGRILEHAARALLGPANKDTLVCGCDLSEGMLEQAKKKVEKAVKGPAISRLLMIGPTELGSHTFINQILTALDTLPPLVSDKTGSNSQGRFDIITLNCVLGELHPSNRVEALRQLGNLLRRDKISDDSNSEQAASMNPSRKNSRGVLAVTEMVFDPHFIGQKELLKLTTEAGLVKASGLWETVGPYWAYTMHFRAS